LSVPVLFYSDYTADDPAPFEWLLSTAAIYAIIVETWAITTGLFWLYTVARWRGRLGRLQCMILGAVCSFLLPVLGAFAVVLIFKADGLDDWMRQFAPEALTRGVMALPAGLFGGWIFWRISVRSAPPPPEELAPIFGP
jgi:hypothetical protein